MSNDQIRDQWTRIPHKLQRRWHKLTREDVEAPDGDSRYLAETLQRRYGIDRREAFMQVYEFELDL